MNIFESKTILVTGHTGFKGSWLTAWLTKLGAKVVGLSDKVPTSPSHFDLLSDTVFDDLRIDVRDSAAILKVINEHQPDFVFHLAAKSIVLDAYNDPLETFSVNAMGTACVLDALRKVNHDCVAVLITSDKCYDNVEWTYGYRETDRLGGKDPYSGSKGAAELVIRSYFASYFSRSDSKVRVGVGRAGNVIGGGDWAPYRVVPDCMRFWAKGESPEIRNPSATRPWQHVLEPLSGYLSLANALFKHSNFNGEAFNFGPLANQNHSVMELVNEMKVHWPDAKWLDKSDENSMPPEAGLLKLNCDKAIHGLSWQATLNFNETAKWTADWYKAYYENGDDAARNLTVNQISKYMSLAQKRNSFQL